MSTNRPDPGEFFERAQQMLRELFGGAPGDTDPWGGATRPPGTPAAAYRGNREPSAEEQRENLTFALATRAVEALEDMALNVAAIRQRLERMDGPAPASRLEGEHGGPAPAGASDGDQGPATT
jgi:hypothetical protein